ncbi:MucBP domain-containing protein [Limosilactobacillus caecicola]|uniref:MucBP domain-containing protein n=1 Tax=Limosilactobacillus caecicola TaxID=2941332 RepID=UPI00203F7BCF|nr:MucBP domain-containing protein [Limosilactobacillus caecicola]
MNTLKTGRPIWVYYLDIDSGSNIIVPQLVRGFENDGYTVVKKDFPQYKLVKTTGKTSGTFDGSQEDVHFYYRKKGWGEIEDIDMYLYLEQPTVQYDRVEGMAIDNPLPGQMYVRSFQRVATTKAEFWYEVNADRWIKFDVNTMKIVHQDPFAKEPPVKDGPVADLRVLPLNKVPATVDYLKGGHLYTYDYPYGKSTDTVANGQDLILVGRMEDENGVTWYQDESRGFINGAYVRLANEVEDE